MAISRPAIIISIAAVGLLLLYFLADARKGGFPACPFWSLTKLYCPGCGSQRGLSALLHGDLTDALRYNLLLVAAIPILAFNGYTHLKKDKQRPPFLYQSWFAKTVLLVVLLFWVLRNIPVYPFTFLAPVHP